MGFRKTLQILTNRFGYFVQFLLSAADQNNVEASASKLQKDEEKPKRLKMFISWCQNSTHYWFLKRLIMKLGINFIYFYVNTRLRIDLRIY